MTIGGILCTFIWDAHDTTALVLRSVIRIILKTSL
jgi:hypothetical protein